MVTIARSNTTDTASTEPVSSLDHDAHAQRQREQSRAVDEPAHLQSLDSDRSPVAEHGSDGRREHAAEHGDDERSDGDLTGPAEPGNAHRVLQPLERRIEGSWLERRPPPRPDEGHPAHPDQRTPARTRQPAIGEQQHEDGQPREGEHPRGIGDNQGRCGSRQGCAGPQQSDLGVGLREGHEAVEGDQRHHDPADRVMRVPLHDPHPEKREQPQRHPVRDQVQGRRSPCGIPRNQRQPRPAQEEQDPCTSKGHRRRGVPWSRLKCGPAVARPARVPAPRPIQVVAPMRWPGSGSYRQRDITSAQRPGRKDRHATHPNPARCHRSLRTRRHRVT